jgi:predicted transcriptional regulator of viral defense system
MDIMRAIEILQYLQQNHITVFTTNDLSRIIDKSIVYTRKIVGRLPGIMKAERGVFYTEQANIYEISSNIVPFSYVSMLAALRYYDITTQMPIAISVISPKRHRAVKIKGYKIEFTTFKRNLIFGYVRRGNAFIAEPEKALLDSLYYGDYAYLDEALLRGVREGLVNIDKMVGYAQRFNKKALINKLGFFLEFYCGTARDDLLGHRSAGPVYLAKGLTRYDKKWRVHYG